MAVYVDQSRNRYRGMIMCHMIADSIAELHAMAHKLALKPEWFQARSSTPHYDVSLSKRLQAIALGAIPLNRRQFVAVIRRLRSEKQLAAVIA